MSTKRDQNRGFSTCSASTTASNSQKWEKRDKIFDSVICDWLSFRHDFPPSEPQPVLRSGMILKIDRHGVVENEIQQWEQIRCPSSDTSIRVKCDGRHLWFQGNIGRFREQSNLLGHTLAECFDKAAFFINALMPDLDTRFFGTSQYDDTIAECGTYLTRIDLAGNFRTSEYLALSQQLSSRRIGQRVARVGKYGPTWEYDTKRSQFWKAKLYDKIAEMDGQRTPNANETIARFEVQLGSEYLRQYKLNRLKHWSNDMDKIIYGRFASQAFAENSTVESWSDIPTRLRQHAIMWRDGLDPKSYLTKSAYYRARSALMEYGIDISSPCNVMNLTQRIKVIEVQQLNAYRNAA